MDCLQLIAWIVYIIYIFNEDAEINFFPTCLNRRSLLEFNWNQSEAFQIPGESSVFESQLIVWGSCIVYICLNLIFRVLICFCRFRKSKKSAMGPPPVLSLVLPSETGRVLSIQSHTVQVLFCFEVWTLTLNVEQTNTEAISRAIICFKTLYWASWICR